MEYLLGLIYMAVCGAVIYSMSVLILQGEKNISNKMYLACHVMVFIWCSSQVLLLLSKTTTALVITYAYGNLGICFEGAFWILFAASYKYQSFNYSQTGNNAFDGRKIWSIPARYMIPVALSAVNYIIVLTNGLHHKYYTTFEVGNVVRGPLFYVNVAEIYSYIIIGAILLFRNVRLFKKQNGKMEGTQLLVTAVIFPVVFSAISISGLIGTKFDITALGFAISVILVRIATGRYQFFDMKRQLDIATESLILEKERNRIAQQVHDTTGHTLTMLQSYMKLVEVDVREDNKEEALEYISEARSLTGKGIKELRESINQLRQGEDKQMITSALMQLAGTVKEIPCEVTIKGEDSENYSHLTKCIHDTARECITNTLKYAEAGRIDIIIRFKENNIDLMVTDDGKGCDNINDNNGLRGIKERVNKAGGSVKFISSEGQGFITRVSLPL